MILPNPTKSVYYFLRKNIILQVCTVLFIFIQIPNVRSDPARSDLYHGLIRSDLTQKVLNYGPIRPGKNVMNEN